MSPVEHLLNALASCMTTAMVYHAAEQGIRIDALKSELEGTLDARGTMGLSKDGRKGYQNITVKFRLKRDAPGEKLRELCEVSPVLDVVSHGTNVDIEVEKAGEDVLADDADHMPTKRWNRPGNIGPTM